MQNLRFLFFFFFVFLVKWIYFYHILELFFSEIHIVICWININNLLLVWNMDESNISWFGKASCWYLYCSEVMKVAASCLVLWFLENKILVALVTRQN